MKSEIENITVCLLGDDRERSYPVVYTGEADFPRWEREAGDSCVGTIPVALITIDEGREALIAQHPDFGWCSVGTEFCRDFDPEVDQERISRAI